MATRQVASTGPDGYDYDVLVVGSGFGGGVTALRLTEKGYRVGVLESGRRFADHELPRTSWRARDYLWAPKLGMRGIQRIHLLRDVMILAGAGVGGGSLVYANTLYEPLDPFFADPQWAHITDWRSELAPFYDQAERMLGCTTNPLVTPSDRVMREVAADMGVGDTYHSTPVGVYFGEPGETADDPYFGGAGPRRTGCIGCGECMTGCRHGAKNMLTANYLWLAERGGAAIHPLTTVTGVRPRPGGGYDVETERTGSWVRKGGQVFTAGEVVFAAGAYGTQTLLHKLRQEGRLPRISSRLGELTRTNSEAIIGAMSRNTRVDYSQGVAITSSFHPDERTHLEPVRYGKGSNAMGLLATILVDGGGRVPRWLRFLGQAARHPVIFVRSFSVRRWSERTVIMLAMQTHDNSITVFHRRGPFGGRLSSRQGHGEPNPTWIPTAHEATRRVAEKIDGAAGGTVGDVFNVPITAHFIGGCVIGDSPETGVIDAYHRMYGHPGLHVVDGSTISANPGVNPSLTITAQAERAMSMWPNKGEDDPRPELGADYRRVAAVAPRHPAVPETAPGALRITPVRNDP